MAAAPLLAPLPAAAGRAMTLGPVSYATLPGCDNPTPVWAPARGLLQRVRLLARRRDASAPAGSGSGPTTRFVASDLTARGDGAAGLKLSGALVEGGTLYLLERNLTRSGGMRLGRSASVAQPRVTWTGTLDFGWGSFAQASPDGYQYVYLRDSHTAYGTADRVDLARVPKGRVADLAAWEVFAGSPAAPAWLPWARRAARKPVLVDSNRINRPHVSHLNGCWTMAVTMPPGGKARGGSGSRSTRRPSPTGRGTGGTTRPASTWARARSSRRSGRATLLTSEGDRFDVALLRHAGWLLSRAALARPRAGALLGLQKGPPLARRPEHVFPHNRRQDSLSAGARQGAYDVGGSAPPACSSASRCAACRSLDSSSTAAVASSSAHRSPRLVE